MSANIAKFIVAGFERLHWTRVNSDGVPTGTASGSLPANGADVGVGKLDWVKTADIQIAESEEVVITGDDDVAGQFIFSPATLPSFNIEVASSDFAFAAQTQSTTNRALGDFTFFQAQPNAADPVDMALILTSRAKSKETSTDGTSGFHHVVVPKAQILPLGRSGFTERGEAIYRYRVIANKFSKYPWGVALTNADDGTTGAVYFEFFSDYRVALHTFVGDNSATSFTVDYTPVNDTDVVKFFTTSTGAAVTVSTITPGTKTIELSAAPAAAAAVSGIYAYTL